jgi:glycosyltransferase involved in cell wall biosynthesis
MHQKFSVLHLFNGATGGAAMSTIALIRQLETLGIGSCAICDDMGTPDERARIVDAVDGKARFAPLYWWNRKIRAAKWKRPLLEVRQLLRTGFRRRSTNTVLAGIDEWKPALVHTNTLLTPEGAMAANKRGLPHVWHVRELVGRTAPFQLPLAEHALGSYLAQAADRVIANSYITAACLSPFMPAESLTVIPNGIDCSAFRNLPVKAWAEPIVVAMVGNLSSRWKKHHLLIEAAAKVDPQLKIEWRIYGHDPSEGGRFHTDPYMNSLRALSRDLRVDDKLKFPGHCPPQQIMQEIDILLHPADAESFGRVLVEAMAAGKPVVSVNAGGASELITHEQIGLLAPPDDSQGLARCIERLLRDADLRARLAAAGRERVERDYTIEVHAQRVAKVYEEVLQNHGSRQPALHR